VLKRFGNAEDRSAGSGASRGAASGDKNAKKSPGWAARWPGAVVLIAFIATLSCAALLNFIVNPFGLYPGNLLDYRPENYRKQKFLLVHNYKLEPETVIIGSSRAMTMPPREVSHYLPGLCFNFSVASATAEDYYAIAMLTVDELGIPISRVVLAVDYEAFNPVIPVLPEARYFGEFSKHFVLSPNLKVRKFEKFEQLISLQQTDESYNVLLRKIRGSDETPKLRVERDGLMVQVAREKAIAEGTFKLAEVLAERVRKYPERSLKLSGYTGVDARRMEYLELFLDFCDEHGIAVYAYITPYHPELWKVLDGIPGSKVLDTVRETLDAKFAEHGVTLHDFSRIKSFLGDKSRFYDEIHPMPITQIRILRELFAREGIERRDGGNG